MASIYEKPPLALLEKSFDEKNLPKELYKMQNKDPRFDKLKAEIHIDSSRLGVEFTVDKTIPDFNKGAEKIHLDWTTSFEEFENVLEGQYKTAWKQVMHDHFPEPVDAAMVPTKHDRSLEENFRRAIELFLKKALHKEKPRDRQYTSTCSRTATTMSGRRSPQNPLTIFINGRKCCAWWNYYPRATSRSLPQASPWNGSI